MSTTTECERFLRDTLDSVLRQTYSNYELILVDDGSTDSTSKICDEYAQKDDRIKVIHQENMGMSKARDVGYQMAMPNTSIAFLDGDDIFLDDMFENMMQFKEHSIVQVCSKHVNSKPLRKFRLVRRNNRHSLTDDLSAGKLETLGNTENFSLYRRIRPLV